MSMQMGVIASGPPEALFGGESLEVVGSQRPRDIELGVHSAIDDLRKKSNTYQKNCT